MRNDDDRARKSEPSWRRYLRFLRPNLAADLDDELRDHLESTAEELVARGMDPATARAEAARRFGDVRRVRDVVNRLDQRQLTRRNRITVLETVVQDIRYAARGLRRSLAFTIVATVSIALGIAANATIFSVVNAALFRPIPGTHADRLVRIYQNHHSPFQWDEIAWYRDHARSFDYIVGERYQSMSFRASPEADAERARTSYVTRGFFPALGVTTAMGRTFDADDRDAGAPPVAVISHAFWQRRFAGDSTVLGRTVAIADHPVTIVGVLSPAFRSSVLGWSPELFVPIAVAPAITGHPLADFGGSLYTTGRLRSGIDATAGEAELTGLTRQLVLGDTARYGGMTVRLDHIRGVNAEERAGVALGSAFLMAMVGLVLLIACANVANLLLGRASTRHTEFGVRLAIGASRVRLVRQLLTESLMLAAMGGFAGFAAARAITGALPSLLPPEAGMDAAFLRPDGRVVLFTSVLCLVTTLLFGLAPSLRAASTDLVTMLKGADARARQPGRGRGQGRRGLLVVGQAAVCVVLLAVASLFLRSLASSQTVDPGFRADGIVDVDVDLGLLGKGTNASAIFARVLRDVSTLPSVGSATLAAVVPLSGSNMETRATPEGMVVRGRRDAPMVYFNIVGPRYFTTLQIPLRSGREFTVADDSVSTRVAVVNETAARRLWPDGGALGRRVQVGGQLYQIVGVARDANYVSPGEVAKATVYLPFAQAERRTEMTLQIRTSGDLASTRRAVWALLRDAAPQLPPPPVVRMADDIAIMLIPLRLGAGLLGAFGALALVLAAAGIYGVASYSVSSRRREIGIRAALGATRRQIIGMVLWENGRRVALGAGVGLALATLLAIGLRTVLYGVRLVDPLALGGVLLTITMVAAAASIGPARRAANADPVRSIRSE